MNISWILWISIQNNVYNYRLVLSFLKHLKKTDNVVIKVLYVFKRNGGLKMNINLSSKQKCGLYHATTISGIISAILFWLPAYIINASFIITIKLTLSYAELAFGKKTSELGTLPNDIRAITLLLIPIIIIVVNLLLKKALIRNILIAILAFINIFAHGFVKSQINAALTKCDFLSNISGLGNIIDVNRTFTGIINVILSILMLLIAIFQIVQYFTEINRTTNLPLCNTHFCSECGNSIDQTMSFCPNCGSQIALLTTPTTDECPSTDANPQNISISTVQNTAKLFSKNKTTIIFIIAIVVSIILATVGILAFQSSKKIYLEDYLSIEYRGKNGAGTVIASIDNSSLSKAFSNKKISKMRNDLNQAEILFYNTNLDTTVVDIFFNKYVRYKINPSYNLSNGEKVTVTWEISPDVKEKFGLNLIGEPTEYIVEGLEEIEDKKVISQTEDKKANSLDSQHKKEMNPDTSKATLTDWKRSHLTRINEIMNDSVYLPYEDIAVAFTDFDRFYDNVNVYFALIDINNDNIDELIVSATNNGQIQYGQLYIPASSYEDSCIPETGFNYYDSDNHIIISQKENQVIFYKFDGESIERIKEYKKENDNYSYFNGSKTTTISQKDFENCLTDNGITDENRISGIQMSMKNVKEAFDLDIYPDGRDWRVSDGVNSTNIYFDRDIVASYAAQNSEIETEKKIQKIIKDSTDEYYVSSVFFDFDSDGSDETLVLTVPNKEDIEDECDSGVTASLWYIKGRDCKNLFSDRDYVGLELDTGTFSDGTKCFISYEYGADGRIMDTVFWIKDGKRLKELQHLTGGQIEADGNITATTFNDEGSLHLVTNCYTYNNGTFTLYKTFETELD